MKNNKTMEKMNKKLMKLTDAVITGYTCFFLWGEPEVSEKLSKFYKKDNLNKK